MCLDILDQKLVYGTGLNISVNILKYCQTRFSNSSDVISPYNPKNTCQKHIALKGQMHHHDDLGSKCAYTCHLSNKTTRKSDLLSSPQIWLMKVSKKTGLSLGIEADIIRSGA